MPQSTVGHLVYSVRGENLPFYKSLFAFLGWTAGYDVPEMLGLWSSNGVGVWFGAGAKAVANDYDGPGLNHLALHVESVAAVDETVAYLKSQGVAALFETPRHRPDFSEPGKTYYQVMFESPDRVLFEVVYVGPYTA